MKNKKSTASSLNSLWLKYFGPALIGVILTICATATVSAQSMSGSTPIAMAPGSPAGSYQLGTFDSVNYYSGSINFNLPLLTVGGRGGVQVPVSVPITRRPWHEEYWTETVPYNGEGHGETHYYPTTQWWSAETRLGIPVLAARRAGSSVRDCGEGFGVMYGITLTRLTFTAPDGTEYELRDTATGGRPFTRSCSPAATSRGKNFATADGSSAVFVSDADIVDPVDSNDDPNQDYPSGILILRDGTKYKIVAGVPAWVMDRNGNKITYSHQASVTDDTPCSYVWSNNCTTLITDPLGRVVTIEHDGYDDVITYQGFGGEPRTIRVEHCNPSRTCLAPGFTGQTALQLFPELPDANRGPSAFPDLITSVRLPNGQSYEFRYNPYGELARVELPTGGIITYDWDGGLEANSSGCTGTGGVVYRRIVRRGIYSASSALENLVTISRLSSTGYVDVATLDPTYATINTTRHYYWGDPEAAMVMQPTDYSSWKEGKEYKTEYYAANGSTLLRKVDQDWNNTAPTWWTGTFDAAPANKAVVYASTTTLADTGQIFRDIFWYDQYQNLTDTFNYDFGTLNGGTFTGALLRRSHTDYVTDSAYTASVVGTSAGPHMISLPSASWVSSDYDGAYKVSFTQYEYDNYTPDSLHAALIDRTTISGHDSSHGPSFAVRGNATKVTTYANAASSSGAVYSAAQYDIAGNVIKTIDPRGNATTINYTDTFGEPNGEARTISTPYSSINSFAFPTSSTNWLGTTYTQFDYYSGKPVDAEDINGTVSSAVYDDDLDRQTQVVVASNPGLTALKNQTTISYDDLNRKVTVTGDLRSYNDNLLKSESFYDGFGRTTESRKYDVATYSAVRTEYDALGRAYKSSNPFRPALSESPVWTTSTFDALGRVISVTTPDSAVLSKSYSGNQTTVTDQAGKKRRGFANALGQTIKVVEDPDTLAYETTYLFDAAGNLRKTSQGTSGQIQYRYFSYDSLGRLLRSKQPEQGTNSGISFTDPLTGNTTWAESFTYDENGNMLTKTDARGLVTTLTYDALNRPLTKDFSDTTSITPDVTMTYDGSGISHSKGHLTQVASPASTTNFTGFDELGRVTASSQTMAGVSTPYAMSYTYGRSGALLTETYPSGRVVANTVDDAGQLSKVTSQEASQPERTYAQNFVYTAAGAVERLRLGNSRWESYQYNNRLQVTQIGLGASAGDTSLLKLDFDYNTSGNHDNNGALLKQTITLPGTTTLLTQSYTYDALNRLQSATEMFGSSQSWKQSFLFDRFGNRTFNTSSGATTTLPSSFSVDIYNPAINAANNRYSSSSYTYDLAGNVTANAAGQSFVYDAEQHQTEVRTTSTNALVASYKYDGSGQRVKKIVGTEETAFIYDAMGKSVAEYVLNSTTSPNVRTRYVTLDQLGSSRAITDGTGQVQERHDYTAYGEEAGSGLSTVRTTAQKYAGTAGIRKRYTGYERDDESGLDYAQARYYNNAHGRFTSVDPLTASATIKNPQTFNRYSYALNSPYKFTDPLGLVSVTSGVIDPELNRQDEDPPRNEAPTPIGKVHVDDPNAPTEGHEANGKDVKTKNRTVEAPTKGTQVYMLNVRITDPSGKPANYSVVDKNVPPRKKGSQDLQPSKNGEVQIQTTPIASSNNDLGEGPPPTPKGQAPYPLPGVDTMTLPEVPTVVTASAQVIDSKGKLVGTLTVSVLYDPDDGPMVTKTDFQPDPKYK